MQIVRPVPVNPLHVYSLHADTLFWTLYNKAA